MFTQHLSGLSGLRARRALLDSAVVASNSQHMCLMPREHALNEHTEQQVFNEAQIALISL